VADVVPIFIAPTPNMLHHNTIGVTYVRTSNFRMEPIRFVPLYYVLMPMFMIIVTKDPFVLALVQIVVGIMSKPHIQKGT
jgi:hypothetical protein